MSDNTMTELWLRLLDCHVVRVTRLEELHYGGTYETYTDKPTAEDIESAEIGEVWYRVTLASFSDYSGAAYDRANVKELVETYGASEGSGIHGHEFAYVEIGDPDMDEDKLSLLVEIAEGMCDYPIICEETWSQVEEEIAEEMWGAFLEDEVRDEIGDMFSANSPDDEDAYDRGLEFFDENSDAIREAYYTFSENEWEFESATSAVNRRHEDAVRHAVQTVAELVRS